MATLFKELEMLPRKETKRTKLWIMLKGRQLSVKSERGKACWDCAKVYFLTNRPRETLMTFELL